MLRRRTVLFGLSLVCSLTATLALADQPNPQLTPGRLCSQSDPNFDGLAYPEQIAHCRRNLTDTDKAVVAQGYGLPRNQWATVEFDHLIPLCAGGSNDLRNIWPENLAHAHAKDKVEDYVCVQMRAGHMTQAQAVAAVFQFLRDNP